MEAYYQKRLGTSSFTVGKYYVPSLGGFLIYALMVGLLLAFPGGLFRSRR